MQVSESHSSRSGVGVQQPPGGTFGHSPTHSVEQRGEVRSVAGRLSVFELVLAAAATVIGIYGTFLRCRPALSSDMLQDAFLLLLNAISALQLHRHEDGGRGVAAQVVAAAHAGVAGVGGEATAEVRQAAGEMGGLPEMR